MQPSLTNNRLAERMSLDVDESLSDHDIPIAPLHLETINYPASPRTRKRELFKESSISSGQSRHSFFSSPRRLGPHKKEEDLGESTVWFPCVIMKICSFNILGIVCKMCFMVKKFVSSNQEWWIIIPRGMIHFFKNLLSLSLL